MMLRKSLFIHVSTVLVAALLAAGCGSDDSPTTGTGESAAENAGGGAAGDADAAAGGGGAREPITVETGSLSRARFAKRVNAICRRSTEEAQEAVLDFTGRSSQADEVALAAEAAEIAIAIFERQIDQIVELGAPKSDEAEVAAILNAMQKDLDKAEARPLAFFKGESFATADKPAKAYGLNACVP